MKSSNIPVLVSETESSHNCVRVQVISTGYPCYSLSPSTDCVCEPKKYETLKILAALVKLFND